jgi:tungstate transport system ATP-binding protein
MTAPALAYRITALQHRYGDRIVLDVPAIDIARGETLAIIGPSGAGKSTLLRLLQFLERPAAGTIEFLGRAATYPVPLELSRTVATVFQRSQMLERSVRDNVAFGMRLRGRRLEVEVDTLLERLALTHLTKAAARSLSGGEMQRVALARAIATGADVLLLDEPAANLDPRNVAVVESVIRDLQAQQKTVVLVTHNTHEARRLASRTLVVIDGRMIEAGPTDTIFERPADSRTDAFLRGELIY